MFEQSRSEAGIRKRYDTPILRTLRLDQAALFLVGYAYEGHRGAIEMIGCVVSIAEQWRRFEKRMSPEGLIEGESGVMRVGGSVGFAERSRFSFSSVCL